MAFLKILYLPDARLRIIASEVLNFDRELEHFVSDMLETMYHFKGIGLAATQVNIHKRVITVDVSGDKSQPQVLINPTIVIIDKTPVLCSEGCLSIPGHQGDVRRPQHIGVKYQNAQGQPLSFEAKGMLAVCIQHEIDHLDGILYIDHLDQQQRSFIESAITTDPKINDLQ